MKTNWELNWRELKYGRSWRTKKQINLLMALQRANKDWVCLFGLAAEHLAPWGGVCCLLLLFAFSFLPLISLIKERESRSRRRKDNFTLFYSFSFISFNLSLSVFACLHWAEPLAALQPITHPWKQNTKLKSKQITLLRGKHISSSINQKQINIFFVFS